MRTKARLASVFTAVFFLSMSFAFCQLPKASKEMEQYLHNPAEYNTYKDKFIRSFPEKTFKDPRAQPPEEMDEPIRRSIERGVRFNKKDKGIASLPERYVREKRTYQLSRNYKVKTESEVRRKVDGSSYWDASVSWSSEDQ